MSMLAVSVTQLPTGVEGGAELAATAITFALLPAALALCTAFPRIFVTLSILRQGLGIGSVPGNLILTGLAAALTFAAMGPTLDAAWKGGMGSLAQGTAKDPMVALRGAEQPLRDFMFDQMERSGGGPTLATVMKSKGVAVEADKPVTRRDVDTMTLVPAFAMNELRVACMLGFKILLPFLAIDLAVAATLASLGMFMTPPTLVSLPLKLMLFVAVDGWALVSAGLVSGVLRGTPA
jgi:flagellar biosynthetic protein FliP